MNSARLRQRLSIVYATATLAGSRVFHASSAIRAFRVALSAVKGGSGGRSIVRLLLSLFCCRQCPRSGRTKAGGQPSPPRRKLDGRRSLAGKNDDFAVA